jgi:quercetin dioxygenase-like cupin family protein
MTTQTTTAGAHTVRREGGPGWQVIGDLVRVKTTAEDSGGAYEMFEIVAPPGPGAPPHRHAVAETFYVLEGRFRFPREDGTAAEAGPGDAVVVPSGAFHTYENVGDVPGRFLVVAAPAGLGAFFAELGTPVADDVEAPAPLQGPPDVGRILEVCGRHGIEIVGGPPA